MKRLFFILSVAALFSCNPQEEQNERTGTVSFSLPDTVELAPYSDRYDSIYVYGVQTYYSAGLIQSISIDADITDLSNLSFYAITPDPYYAYFEPIDWGYSNSLTGSDLSNVVFDYNSTTPIENGTAPYTGNWAMQNLGYGYSLDSLLLHFAVDPIPMNGYWLIYTMNNSGDTWHINNVTITFNN